MHRIELFLSLIKKAPMEELFQLKEVMVCMKQLGKVKELYSYEAVQAQMPAMKIQRQHFEAGWSMMQNLEPLLEKEGICYVSFLSSEYPLELRQVVPVPKILYYKGNKDLLRASCKIAVVGSRKPTPYGIWVTRKLTLELVKNNFCIVSGMASGVDGISHEEAIKNDGKTICVLGSSIDKPYPKSNIKLMQRVLESGGLVLSEYSPLDKTLPVNFALRNRIVSGLSEGVLITEAGMKSGTLITANYALEQGKSIFAVPGNIDSKYSIGTNGLIKDGAIMTRNIYDILDELKIQYHQEDGEKSLPEMSESERMIYEQILSRGIAHIEQIATGAAMDIQDVMGILNIMEIKGLIHYDGFMASIV